jgi:hypothetical protein
MEKNSARPLGAGLTVLAAAARLAQHLNFAPVGALSLFAGARMRGWRAYLLPLGLMAITDPLVGGYSFATPFVYASYLLNVWIGSRLLRNTENPLRIGAAAGIGSLQFFVVSNLAVWISFPTTYAHTLQGLVACYTAAIPFYGRTLAADLFYSAALFGLHALLSRTVVRSERVAAPAVA